MKSKNKWDRSSTTELIVFAVVLAVLHASTCAEAIIAQIGQFGILILGLFLFPVALVLSIVLVFRGIALSKKNKSTRYFWFAFIVFAISFGLFFVPSYIINMN
jgi:hypothetical protein